MGTKKNKKKDKGNQKKNWGYYLGIIGNILIWTILLSYFLVLPLYFKNGYEMIATNKYKCFMAISKYSWIALGVYLVVFFATWGITKEEIKDYLPVWKIDVSMLGFVFIALISHMASSYKKITEPQDYFYYEGSLYGASGWFMGLMTFVILVALYFAISRFFIYSNKIWYPILLVATVIFIWGSLNRYQIYPIEMKFQGPSFVASMGNINWFAGYESVLFPIIVGLYWASKDSVKKYIIAVTLFIGSVMLLLNGSDSAVMSFCVTMFVLLLVSLKDETRMVRFSEIMCIFSLSGIVICVIDKIFPEKRDYSSALAEIFASGVTSIVIFVLCIVLRTYLLMVALHKVNYPMWLKTKCSKVLLFVTGTVIVLFILLITVNTKTGGALPVIGKSKLFIFDRGWGSARGATWTSGVLNFAGLSFGKKLIGVGPDMFYYALRDNVTAFEYAAKTFGESRLTNSHNEILTLLVNVGILGAGSFVAMCSFAIKKFIEESKEHPYIIAFALSMVMYLANNTFSFEQITNLPFFFLIIGIGAAAVVKENRA